MKKTIQPGRLLLGYDRRDRRRTSPIKIDIEYEAGGLSISGSVNGGCGQIGGDFAHRDPRDNDGRTTYPIPPSDIEFAPGWDEEMWYDLLDVWKRWHLNDMRSCCEHQREMGWDKEPIDRRFPTSVYGRFYPGQSHPSWNMKVWVHPPHGHLTEPCPVCGYRCGTKWLHEDVPDDVIEFLESLPENTE